MNSRASGNTILWLLKILMQWGQKTLMFSLSVFALWLLGSLSAIVFVFCGWFCFLVCICVLLSMWLCCLSPPVLQSCLLVRHVWFLCFCYYSVACSVGQFEFFLKAGFCVFVFAFAELFEQGDDSVNSWLYFVFASFKPVHGGCDFFHCGFFACSFYVLEIASVFFLGVAIVFIGICYLL